MATTVDREPEQIDFNVRRGDTWILDFTFCVPTTAATTGSPADLTGSAWRLQIREGTADGALFATATIDATAQSSGYVVGRVETTATTGATAARRAYYYDLEQTRNGTVATPVAGYLTVSADASRSV